MLPTTDEGGFRADHLGRTGVPQKLSLLRWKLGQKAKQEPKFRFYALYDRIYRLDVLQTAYQQVRRLKSAAGVDEIRFGDIESTSDGVEKFLAALQEDLRSKRYRPLPVRRVMIPKANGGQRPLGIPSVRDRVVQMAALLILEPIFESDFCDSSFGFRPQRNAHQALEQIQSGIGRGKQEIYDADLQGYFDTIPHENLMRCVEHRISDRAVLRLIRMWLQSPIEEIDQQGQVTLTRPESGTPQGGVISPLLANLYLHWFEVMFHSPSGPAHWAKAELVRYADDFVVLAYFQGATLIDWIETTLETKFSLTINREKTKIVRLSQGESLDFLGFTLRYERSVLQDAGQYLHVGPSRQSMTRLRDRLRELTSPRQCFKPLTQVVQEVNRMMRGWGNYFGHGHSRRAFAQANWFAYNRVARHANRRSQRGCRPPKDRSIYAHLYHYLSLQKLGNHK
ncbi:MAG: group II intron reverse transcriptase/maturase [Blastopirellula sp.]|nr:MAG: group II intron reverse transcriptase/maturase [Blastopirellula sp.]